MSTIDDLLRRLPRDLYVYGDESGALVGSTHFLLGLLLTRNPDHHERHIGNLRIANRFTPEIKYSSNDKFKVPICEDLIRYVLAEPDLRFRAMVIDNDRHALERFTDYFHGRRSVDVAYNYHYKKHILRSTPEKQKLIIVLDDRQRVTNDNLPEYLAREIPNVKNLQLVDSKKHQLVQAADLLTGCIYGDLTNVQGVVKRGLIDFLKKSLGVSSLVSRKLQRVGVDAPFGVHVW